MLSFVSELKLLVVYFPISKFPAEGVSIKEIIFKSVDFPDPDGY